MIPGRPDCQVPATARFLESVLPAGLDELFSKPDELLAHGNAHVPMGRTDAQYALEVVGPIPE